MSTDFANKSYELHSKHFGDTFDQAKLESWEDKSSIDYWRHERMYSHLDPLIEQYPDASWLTLGDGRYGTDANYLQSKGAKTVLATDISEAYLKKAKENGFINDYKIENAESLSFNDEAFDFVLCKESYHHFPRPMVALYEMLRVAKYGVILIEPQDSNIAIPAKITLGGAMKWCAQALKNKLKSLMGKAPYYNFGSYEDVGNYVYTISEREIEKVGLGLNYDQVSLKGINDYYTSGVEYEKADNSVPLFGEVKGEIAKADRLSASGKKTAGLLIAMIHKTPVTSDLRERLASKGIEVRDLSKNPYV